MTANQKNKNSPVLNLLADLLALPVSLIPVIVAWGIPIYLLLSAWPNSIFYVVLLLLPFIASFSLILSVRIVRLFLPRLRKGVYPLGMNKGFISWYLHLSLSRAADLASLKSIIQ